MIPPVTTDIPVVEPAAPTAEAPPQRNIFLVPLAVILAVALFMAGWYTAAQSSTGQATAQTSATAALSPDTLADRIEADGVEIVYTDDPELNCAATTQSNGSTGQGGCVYMGTTPERMYVSEGMEDAAHVYVLVHEYAHILQARGQWPVGGASATGMGTLDSECWADVYALSEGIPYNQLHYIKTCVFPGGLSLPTSP